MKIPLLVFIFLTLLPEVNACDCASPAQTFMESLWDYTAEFEVVQMDTLSAEGKYEFWPIVLIKLKVVKSFTDTVNVNYVWMNSSVGPDCERGLFPNHIGQRYIITGHFIEDKRYDKWIGDGPERNFLYVSTCGKMVLDIEGSNVFGVITKSNNKQIKKKYDQLMKTDEAKAVAYYDEIYNTKHHPDLVQKMPLTELYKLLEAR